MPTTSGRSSWAGRDLARGRLGGGLPLGQIARAHGGTLTAASTDAETRFTFRMPLSGS